MDVSLPSLFKLSGFPVLLAEQPGNSVTKDLRLQGGEQIPESTQMRRQGREGKLGQSTRPDTNEGRMFNYFHELYNY